MTPDALLRIWMKASCSPCRSLIKCSVPLGKRSSASKRMISLYADKAVGYFSASRVRWRRRSGVYSRIGYSFFVVSSIAGSTYYFQIRMR